MWPSVLVAIAATLGADAAPPRFLALGDSYTIGEGVAESGRWPVQLARRLRERGIAIGEPAIIARTGWTTDELDAAIDAAAPDGDHALVTVLVGVNNQYRGRALDEYRREFDALLARATRFAGGRAGRVIVVSIPDWGVTPFARGRDSAQIAREIDAFNAAARELAAARGIAFVDVTAISRVDARTLLAEDGLHPSAAQYTLWAEAVLPAAEQALHRD